MSERKKVRRVLISVYDKNRLEEIGKSLSAAGVEILSTGSTAKTLAAAGIAVTEVSAVTGFPEIMGGRVKTLHPTIHSGILADQDNSEHMEAIKELGIEPFDLIIINLYPFAETIASGASFSECIEQIDIGGPSMLRGAAKNHGSVAVISKTSQYDQLLSSIAAGGFTAEERRQLALEVFRTTAEYDLTIANWLGQNRNQIYLNGLEQFFQRRALFDMEKIHIKVLLSIEEVLTELFNRSNYMAKRCHLTTTQMQMLHGELHLITQNHVSQLLSTLIHVGLQSEKILQPLIQKHTNAIQFQLSEA